MKTLVTLATLLVTTTIAAAQPSLTVPAPAATPTPAAEPTTYLQVGGMVGGIQRALVLGGAIDAGERIGTTPLWVHGVIADGNAAGIDEETYTGSMFEARAGIEARACAIRYVCGMLGVDAAYAHTQYMASEDMSNVSGALVMPRVGVDFGGQHVRVRQSFEVGLGNGNNFQLTASSGIAYQW